jgi:hypothetical protein
MAKRCQDIMTKDPFCGMPTDRVQLIAQLMRDRDVGLYPYVRVTKRSALSALLLTGIWPFESSRPDVIRRARVSVT